MKHLLIIFLSCYCATINAQKMQVPAHLSPPGKGGKTAVKAQAAEAEKPRTGCISGNCETGRGKWLFEDSSYYDGGWKDGQRDGQGTFSSKQEYYSGGWKAGQYDGEGRYYMKSTYKDKTVPFFERAGHFENGVLNGHGVYVYYLGLDSSTYYNGNFRNGEYYGTGSMRVDGDVTYSSDSWTDSKNFTRGKEVRITKAGIETYPGHFAELNFERDGGNASAIPLERGGNTASASSGSSSNSSTAGSSNNAGGKSMLDYGIFDYHKNDKPAAKSAHDYKVYCFVTTCSQGGRQFKVLSKVTADIAKHSMDEIRGEATHRISNNGWSAQGSPEYVGTGDEVHISGTPGRDYTVSEAALYDF